MIQYAHKIYLSQPFGTNPHTTYFTQNTGGTGMRLQTEIAAKFIDSISGDTHCMIMITDSRGIVAASTDRTQIGSYCTPARLLLENDLDTVERDTSGGREIGCVLRLCGEVAGALVMSGNASDIKTLLPVLRRSLETVLENNTPPSDGGSPQDALTDILLYGRSGDGESMQNTELADRALRMPILIALKADTKRPSGFNLPDLLKTSLCGQDELILPLDSGRAVFLMNYTAGFEGFFNSCRQLVAGRIAPALEELERRGLSADVYAGALTDRLSGIPFACSSCMWLEQNNTGGSPAFFYEHVDSYFKSRIPPAELSGVFGAFSDGFSDSFINMFILHMKALYENNYSILESSRSMFVHKNTLSFRLEKIKSKLGINPMQNTRDCELADYLRLFFERRRA